MTDEATNGTTSAEAEPEWFAEAWSLHEQQVPVADIAKAVHKRANDVRKLIRRKQEAIDAQAALDADPSKVGGDGPAGETPEGKTPQPPGEVSAEQAQRLRDAAGDSAGDEDPDGQTQLLPNGSVQGDGFTLRSVGTAREPVTEVTVAMSGGEVPIPKGSGLLDPHKEGMLLVTYECEDAGRPLPIREGERGEKKIVGWKTRQRVRPIYIERVQGEEGVIEGHFAALLEADPARAGAVLDRLLVRAGRKLA